MTPIEVVIGIAFLCTTAAVDFQMEKFPQSPGLYYEHRGEAQLYNVEWKLVTYVNLSEIDRTFDVIKKYVKLTVQFCDAHVDAHWINQTRCKSSVRNIENKLLDLEDTKLLIITSTRKDEQPLRVKRGVFNFIGSVSKILFGTMDEDDASYYADKISEIEKDQVDMLKLTREQVTIVKSTLRSINGTLQDIIHNENVLDKGMESMSKHVNEQTGKIKEMFSVASLAIEMNKHSILLNSLIKDTKQDYEMILSAVMNAQKGILQPHIISPAKIIKLVKDGIANIPSDLSLPFPLSVTYSSVLLKLMEYDVFLHNNVLGYVIRLPLTDNVKFNVYNVHPLPIATKDSVSTFVFIQPEKEFLFIDMVKQYYVKINKVEFNNCKVLNNRWRVCKQEYPVLSSHLHEECEAKLLQHVKDIPSDCSQRVVKLSHTLWTQLESSEWLFVSPIAETLTVSCIGQQPSDVILNGTGKIKFLKSCKGYGSTTLIQSQGMIRSNVTNNDIIPQISLEYDCCLYNNQKVNLSEVLLELPMTHMVNHLADLGVASHKISEVERIIDEQEWKLNHRTNNKHLSFLSYLGLTLMLIMIMVCCCTCRCCRQLLPKLCKWWKDSDSCTKIVFKPKIVTTVHNSNESIEFCPRESSSNRHSLTGASSIELIPLNATSVLKTKAAGKR